MISRTLEEPLTWANSTLVAEDALDAVPRLKAESPVPLGSHGSISMNRALLAAGLVDRLEVKLVMPDYGGPAIAVDAHAFPSTFRPRKASRPQVFTPGNARVSSPDLTFPP